MTGYFSPDATRTAAQRLPAGLGRGRDFARILRFGPPLVSLSALIWAAPALAQTTISNNTATPQVTSTTGDLTIDVGGSVKPPSGVAVTINSSNTFTNNGVIQFTDISNVTGVLAQGGITSQINNNGNIQVDDNSQPSTDDDGIAHGPFANGTNRYGIRIAPGSGDFNGGVINLAGGTVNVKGDNSAGISIETNITGALNNGGTISVTGTNGYAIRTTGKVGGDVTLGGTISGTGQGTQGVNLGDDVAGAVLINGTLATSGYRYTARSTDSSFQAKLRADDLLQGGTTVTIGGSVGKGVLIDALVANADGTVTGATGAITSIGQAPALVVGGLGRSITLGNVGADADAFGLEIKGTVSGAGIYDGISSTGVQLGVAGGTVNTTGGIRVSGSVTAQSYAADAIAMHINSGVTVPTLLIEGQVASTISSDAQGVTGRALLIESGAVVTSLQNANSIFVSVAGQKADAAAIVDRSGTLSEVENIGIISAARTLTTTPDEVTGKAIALDLHLNTTGVHLSQSAPDGATLVPSITGSVTLGSGSDHVEILAGTVTGDLTLGAGANTLAIDNGASVKGALSADSGTLGLTIGKGTLEMDSAAQLKLTGLSVGTGSTLVFTADPSLGMATKLDVTGAATIADGVKIGLRLATIQQGTVTYTLIHADQLTVGALDSTLLGAVPYLYNSSLQTNIGAGTIDAVLSLKTAAQLALPDTTAGAYLAVTSNLNRDTRLEGALLNQTTRSGVINLYNQLLPNHSGSVFNILASSVSAMGRPLDDRQDPVGGGFWMQETNTGVFANGHADDPGYKGWSFGAVVGYEIPKTPLGILGVTFGASTNQLYPDNTDAAQDLHATLFDGGVYWRMTRGGFSANARLAGDYVRVTSSRVIEVLGGDGLAVSRAAHGDWSAYGFNGRAMASYETHFGNVYVRPQASLDYIRLVEGSYSETGGGDGMNLAVNSRTSSRASAFAGVAVGALYGVDRSWGPEALVGYKAVASEVLGVTTARFVAGGDAFTLRSDDLAGSGLAAHLSLKGENGSGGFSLETGAETRDGLNIYDLRLAGHVQF